MEKRRVRLVINGVVCGLITEESDEYMQTLSKEVEDMMKKVVSASPVITKEAAAVTTALNFCDDAKKNEQLYFDIKRKMKEVERKALEVERKASELKKENNQLWEETDALLSQPGDLSNLERARLEKRIKELEAENEVLKLRKSSEKKEDRHKAENLAEFKNPLRKNDEIEQQGFVSFFERDENEN